MGKIIRLAVAISLITLCIVFTSCNKTHNNSVENPSNTNFSNTAKIESLVKTIKQISPSKLKFKEIDLPKGYPSLGGLAVNGNMVFFIAGTGKPAKSVPPCLLYLEKLFSYNEETKEMQLIAEIDPGFVQIDWVDANEDWVVYREIQEEFGGPERIYAINRKDSKKELLLEDKGCSDCEGVVSGHPFNLKLWNGNYLIKSDSKFEPTKRDKSGKITDGLFHETITLVNLITKESIVIFNKSAPLKTSAAIFSISVNSSYIIFNYAEGGNQIIYGYSFSNGKLRELLTIPLMRDLTESNGYFVSSILLTEDNYVIFDYPEDLQKNQFLTVIAPIDNIKDMRSIGKTIPNYYAEWPQTATFNYIVWANRSNDTLYILNRTSGNLTTVKAGLGYLWLSGTELIGAGSKPLIETDKLTLIFIDLFENGF
ncbi:hypothetical protein [Caldisericum sp.]|jgi:hypothetical protein|uniref:hypothetical protein n=1 Tax=Caldisericum sp. TaxID=2499687 RepID=UPI003D0B706D